jgi:hypothetical protein
MKTDEREPVVSNKKFDTGGANRLGLSHKKQKRAHTHYMNR